MSPRAVPLLALLLLVSAVPAGAVSPTPPGAPAAAPEKVRLRWKVPKDAPLGYEYVTRYVTGQNALRLEVSDTYDPHARASGHKDVVNLALPTETAMAVVVSARSADALAAKVVVTRMDTRKMPRKTKVDREMVKTMESMVGSVQVRAALTDWGLVTSDHKREARNLVALLLELPVKPVGVGDTWTHSVDLVQMGKGWQGKSEAVNRAELVSLDKEAEGRTVAVIDFTIAEYHDGQMLNPQTGQVLDASMEMSYVGRGEFLVEEGRWRKLAGQMTTRAANSGTEQQFTLMPLASIPPKVLAAE
jgi:hypothetical protein